uniref:Chromo domain-containing protein n=1 Tax=Panagrolaimus davidi TaxID=227884 RepID=A0A914QHA6_9BILA
MDQIQLSASKQQQPRRSKSSNDDKKYEVEEILEKRVFGKVIDYRVKWKGYDNRYNSWTPKENLGVSFLIIYMNLKHNLMEISLGMYLVD